MKLFAGKTQVLAMAAVLAVLATLVPSGAAADILMRFIGGKPTLEGESTVEGHDKWINLESISWGVENQVNRSFSGGSQTGRASFSDISLSKSIDKSSPKLMEAVALGAHYPDVVIEFIRDGVSGPGATEAYYKIEMKDVLVSSYQTSSGGDRPSESFSLNFGAIKHTYRPQDLNGSLGDPIEGQWNVVTNTADFRGSEESTSNPVPAGSPPVPTGLEVTVEEE